MHACIRTKVRTRQITIRARSQHTDDARTFGRGRGRNHIHGHIFSIGHLELHGGTASNVGRVASDSRSISWAAAFLSIVFKFFSLKKKKGKK